MSAGRSAVDLKNEFGQAAVRAARAHLPRGARPFTFRLSDDERAFLTREAGNLSLSAHVRRKLLGNAVSPRRGRELSRRQRVPKVNQAEFAKVLALLGRSDMHRRLDELAMAAVMGALPVGPELIQELHAVCAHIRAMRATLMDALDIKRDIEDDSDR